MSDRVEPTESGKTGVDWTRTLVACGVIAIAAAAIMALTFSTEPTAKRGGALKQTAMLVDVTSVERGTYRPVIAATGTVEPEQDIVLSPRVSGEIVGRAPDFKPGGTVEKGDVLLRVDPADYRNALEQSKSDLRQARSDLAIEMGRQDVAQKDYELLDQTLSEEKEALVLREPQLEAAKVKVDAARAVVDQAELDLRRTRIQAPFDAHILTREVNVGSQVAPGQTLGRLVGLDTYWVVATVPLSKVRWLSFPDGPGETGSEVRVRNRSAWPEGTYRTGHLSELVGALEGRTRMARVLVTIPDPLALEADSEGVPPLMIGEFVATRIQGEEIEDVVRLDRDHVRDEDTVWVMDDEQKLRIRDVDVVVRDDTYAYISDGLDEGDRVVTTNLSTVTEGAPLRLAGEGDSTSEPRRDGGAG